MIAHSQENHQTGNIRTESVSHLCFPIHLMANKSELLSFWVKWDCSQQDHVFVHWVPSYLETSCDFLFLLGGKEQLKEVDHWEWPMKFDSQAHFLFTLYLLWLPCVQLVSSFCCQSLPTCCYIFTAMIKSILLNCKPDNIFFLMYLSSSVLSAIGTGINTKHV